MLPWSQSYLGIANATGSKRSMRAHAVKSRREEIDKRFRKGVAECLLNLKADLLRKMSDLGHKPLTTDN